MEDRWVAGDIGDASVVGIFDGHDGASVAEHAAKVALDALRDVLPTGAGATELWHRVFERLDPDGATAGSTATLILCRERTLSVAWVGDSRAVLVGAARARALTSDHRIDREEELARCVAAGAEVMPPYVMDPVTSQGVMVTRALGDRALRRIGVTPQPEVVSVPVSSADRGFVVATDGLWDVVDNDEAAAVCRELEPQAAADRLVALVDRREGRDNVTVVVVAFAG